jgi:hypothetical protein
LCLRSYEADDGQLVLACNSGEDANADAQSKKAGKDETLIGYFRNLSIDLEYTNLIHVRLVEVPISRSLKWTSRENPPNYTAMLYFLPRPALSSPQWRLLLNPGTLGAELGLPIGMHFGVTVASWSKTVTLINEPMIQGIAKAAIKAELADGKITAGFTPTEGCQGIHTNLSWRNKLVCNVLDIKEFELLDSGYKSIKSICVLGITVLKETAKTAMKRHPSRQTTSDPSPPDKPVQHLHPLRLATSRPASTR